MSSREPRFWWAATVRGDVARVFCTPVVGKPAHWWSSALGRMMEEGAHLFDTQMAAVDRALAHLRARRDLVTSRIEAMERLQREGGEEEA